MPACSPTLRAQLFPLIFLIVACGQAVSGTTDSYGKQQPEPQIASDSSDLTPRVPVSYDSLTFIKTEELNAAPGTKSVLFNSISSKLYAMNLEGMSVYEFDQATRKVERIFRFKPSKGIGWNYAKNRPIPSFQEKPVEGCLSHNNSILWVSLHNAEGIVPIFLNDIAKEKSARSNSDTTFKKVYVSNILLNTKDSMSVPLIFTGKTPKIISKTADDKYLLVSNWHSHTVSILQTDTSVAPYATKIKDIAVSTIPRGIAVNDKLQKSFVAQMGGAELTVIDNTNWEATTAVQVLKNPRHIVLDTSGRIYVSFNALNSVSCIDATTGLALFSAHTGSQPRTIILSRNYKFLFVTCYAGDQVQVFKIYPDHFQKVMDLPCKGSPVGVDIYEDDKVLEAWVCKYVTGAISVFTFKKR
ncbi:MAG: YncE family protein [Chitinophagaceae bacterium]